MCRLLFGKVSVAVYTDSSALLSQLDSQVCDTEPALLGRLRWARQELDALGATWHYLPSSEHPADRFTKWCGLEGLAQK